MAVDARHDLAAADLEFHRIALARGIDRGPVGQLAGIVDADDIAALDFAHVCLCGARGEIGRARRAQAKATCRGACFDPSLVAEPRM
jgi:hypothetical protein